MYFYTFGRTSWTGDRRVTRPLPTQNNTIQKNAVTYIHALSGIRTHDPSVRADIGTGKTKQKHTYYYTQFVFLYVLLEICSTWPLWSDVFLIVTMIWLVCEGRFSETPELWQNTLTLLLHMVRVDCPCYWLCL